MTEVFVGNLDYQTQEVELEKFLQDLGLNPVRVLLPKHVAGSPHAGQCRGFGFATFGPGLEFKQIVEAINGQNFRGRTLRAGPAKGARKESAR